MTAERVAAAAVMVRARAFTGGSHKEAVFAASLAFDISPITAWTDVRPEDQGFVTSRGRFVSRAQAWVIAKREGQLRWDRSLPGVTPELHSEDLR